MTSGLEQSDFPEGLSVGKITEIEPEQAGGLGTVVRVKPLTDFGALEYVTVLRWVPGQGPVTTTTTTTTVDAHDRRAHDGPESSPTTTGDGNGP